MDLHEALRTRRTISDFREGVIPEEVLLRAFEAAIWAPNHKLTQPWRFVRPGPIARAALAEIIVANKAAAAPMDEAQREKVRRKALIPAEILVVSQVRSADPHRAKEDYAAVSLAIGNAMLSLHADGVGSMWGTGKPTRDPATYALMGIDAEIEEIVGFLWVGYAARPHPAPGRRPVDEVVRTVP